MTRVIIALPPSSKMADAKPVRWPFTDFRKDNSMKSFRFERVEITKDSQGLELKPNQYGFKVTVSREDGSSAGLVFPWSMAQ